MLKISYFLKYKHQFPGKCNLRPDLNGALFMERSGRKKREWRAEMFAQIKNIRKKNSPSFEGLSDYFKENLFLRSFVNNFYIH